MPVLRFLLLLFGVVMTVITVATGVAVMLGIGWLAVAIPVVISVGLLAAAHWLWNRFWYR